MPTTVDSTPLFSCWITAQFTSKTCSQFYLFIWYCFLRAKPKDGLNAKTMNVKGRIYCFRIVTVIVLEYDRIALLWIKWEHISDGGKQPLQRPGFFTVPGEEDITVQHMVYQVPLFQYIAVGTDYTILLYLNNTGWTQQRSGQGTEDCSEWKIWAGFHPRLMWCSLVGLRRAVQCREL